MKKIDLRKIRSLKRFFVKSPATSLAGVSRPFNRESLGEFDSQVHAKELTEPYIHYDEQARIRLHLLELERQRADAIFFARHRTCA